ncbi:MAG: transcriptional repressor [Proteobacteria bacterium]|nr:transcriptional repressor [Pseudomonadota bacterium]MBU1741887.1 transcriptional repressor [Pseudomonadota bacterium]
MTDALKRDGHRLTPQRLAVVAVLAESKGHPSVERIYEQVKKDFPTTSLATIYKTVNLLKELGQVLELGFADLGSRYDGHQPWPHSHVICTRCRRIVDPAVPAMADISKRLARETGYVINHHRLDFFGLCPACRKRD